MKNYLLGFFLLNLRWLEGQLPIVCLAQTLTTTSGAIGTDTTDITVNASCLDRKGQWVKHGEDYQPDPDPCTWCTCEHGKPDMCMMPMCYIPENCHHVPNSDVCCDSTCDVGTSLWGLTILPLLFPVAIAIYYRYHRKRLARLTAARAARSDKNTGLHQTTSGPSVTSPFGLSNPEKKDEVEPITPPPSYDPPPYDDILREGGSTQTSLNVPNHQDV